MLEQSELSDEEMYDIAIEIDNMATGLPQKSADFIGNIIDRGPQAFSPKQRQWILDFANRYLQ